MVLATQNPLEYGGTFPLPEAQLDRFLMRLSLGYPGKDDEIEILKHFQDIKKLSPISSVAKADEIIQMQESVDKIYVHEDIFKYVVNISNVTRNTDDFKLGASPRASIDLIKASKARAFLSNRSYVIPDDVKQMVLPVLSHRLILSSEARLDRKNIKDLLHDVLYKVYVPVISNE